MLFHLIFIQTDKEGIQETPNPPEPPGDEDDMIDLTEHNIMSLECNLINRDEAIQVQEQLNTLDRCHVPVSQTLYHCLFEAVLCNLQPPFYPQQYTGFDLRLQLCMYMIKNHEMCTNILKLRLIAYDTSLYWFILKFMDFQEWGEEILLHIICKMWKITIAVLDPTHENFFRHYGLEDDMTYENFVIIYNGANHYTGTGSLAWFSLLFSCAFFALLIF